MSRNPEFSAFQSLKISHPQFRAIRIEWLTRPWYLRFHCFLGPLQFTYNALLFCFDLVCYFHFEKKIILPLIWTELGDKTPPLRRITRLNTVIKMNQAFMMLQSLKWYVSYASRFRFALVLRHRVILSPKDYVTSSLMLWTTQHIWVHVKSLSRKFRILEF